MSDELLVVIREYSLILEVLFISTGSDYFIVLDYSIEFFRMRCIFRGYYKY
jgi:hypothetical protein